MKTRNHTTRFSQGLGGMAVGLVLLLAGVSQAAGLLKPTNGTVSDVFIKSHDVRVTINNGFAKTEVDQIFGNKSSRDLEAVYSFPIPKQASLSELSLWINGKEVMGEVLERQRARQIFEQETRKRVDPALAEKNGYESFDITVFPVIANGDTRVRLVYYQPIEIESNVGRYVYPLAHGSSDDQDNAFWSVDEGVQEAFSFELELKSAFPVEDVRVPGLETVSVITEASLNVADVDGKETARTGYTVQIQPEGTQSLNRDIVFYYKLSDDIPARIELVPYRKDGRSKGTFMVVVTPAADLKEHTDGADWVFIVDKSGSMRGRNFNLVIDSLNQTLDMLGEKDRYRIVTFNNEAQDVTNGYLDVNGENIQQSIQQLQSLKPGGGTELYRGIRQAYKGLDKSRTTAVLLITDGITELSQSQHSDFLTLLEEYDVRLFTFVIGNSGNQPLMERVAKDSGGFAMNISTADDVTGRILQAKNRIIHEAMYNVEMNLQGKGIDGLTPQQIGNLYHGQQLVMFGQYAEPERVVFELKGRINGEAKSWTCIAELPEVDTDNPELERLWALSQIDDVMQEIRDEGESETLRQRVIELGTGYSLVTDYTSMLVLEEHRFKDFGIDRTNRDRVAAERAAQEQRASQPVKNYRVDQNQPAESQKKNTFEDRRSPGFGNGSGPVGPLFVGLAAWLGRRKRNRV
jgi:Ca-activated chloride channel family protein